MIFPYREVRQGGELRFLPLITISILNSPNHKLNMRALVDSGAEHNVFGTEVAHYLGLSLDDGQLVHIIGVGEQVSEGRLITVEFELRRYSWTAPTIFSDAANQRAILGQAGFFRFFTVTFRYAKREISISRSLIR